MASKVIMTVEHSEFLVTMAVIASLCVGFFMGFLIGACSGEMNCAKRIASGEYAIQLVQLPPDMQNTVVKRN